MMRLLRFHVTDFRSVKDSGWIETDAVTALIGTNESGKTNLLLPLWKLNPAKEGEIDTTDDYPRNQFNTLRDVTPQPVFITAVFEPSEKIRNKLASLTTLPNDVFAEVSVQRRFDGSREVSFPLFQPVRTIVTQRAIDLLAAAQTEITATTELKQESDAVKPSLLKALAAARSLVTTEELDQGALTKLRAAVNAGIPTEPAKTSYIVPRASQLLDSLEALITEISVPSPSSVPKVTDLVLKHLPQFVYYSNYGNLDSEIYLPHVIDNMARRDLGAKDQAKARTLKVLFEFVRLKPNEILELGLDFDTKAVGRQPTQGEIDEIAEKKRQRSILLQSASGDLTKRFRDWWKQGQYRFRFEADGRHFRIWVSDDKRPDEIELEGRSTGLQWFLSFYLVFLVESTDEHEGSILLLDEPGLSLHPMAQRDLSMFFDALAETNQLLFTTHSPFLVDADHLDRARKVYVDADGTSKATPDLRSGEIDPSQRGSNYTVAAALGISVAESLMLGCAPVIVEGPSDQLYLSAIKTLLIANGRLRPARELVFPPAGGAKGVKAAVSIVGAKGDELPLVLVDSDDAGDQLMKSLREGFYAGSEDRVVQFGDILKLPGAEVEDLIPKDIFALAVDRIFRSDSSFTDIAADSSPLVPQVKAWAASNGITIDPGWKVQVARGVKATLLKMGTVDEARLKIWDRLFATLNT